MRLAFIGTSHISGLKLGWGLLPEHYKKNIDVSFIGYPAPVFAKQIYKDWLYDNDKILPTEPGLKYFLEKMSGDPDTPISPLDYDVICFVDMFFCYDFCLAYGSFNKIFFSSDRIPISENTYKTILKDRNGKATYNSHPVVGNVPEVSVFPLIDSIKQINKELKLFLTPRPFIPLQRLDKYKWGWTESSSIVKAGNIFDAAANEKLIEYDVSYLPRTDEQISFTSGVTDNDFSLGVLKDGNTLDEHMNGEYGLHTIKQLLTQLGRS
ncbi:MAG: hypothetical protein ACI88H_000247 [Cocleimonas sp.]